MKRYPKGPSAATPKIKDPTGSGQAFYLVDGKRLGEIMVRAYERHLRWVRHRTSDRRGVVSPFARQRVDRLDYRKGQLARKLAPFQGVQHLTPDTLALLLDDPDCTASVVRDARQLDQEMTFTKQDYYPAFNWLEAFKPGYYASSPERQARLETLYLPYQTGQVLKELRLMYADCLAVMDAMTTLRPAIFPFLTR